MDLHSLSADELALRSVRVQSTKLTQPPVTTIALKIPKAAIKVASYTFPELPAAHVTAASPSLAAAASRGAPPSATSSTRAGVTRLQPPRDIVKLADRLYYLLQPPLESLLTSDDLHFPFAPFPY